MFWISKKYYTLNNEKMLDLLEKRFTDKESYLKWKEEWKDTYKTLSREIREAKYKRKTSVSSYKDAWLYQIYAHEGSKVASHLLYAREDAKLKSIDLHDSKLAA